MMTFTIGLLARQASAGRLMLCFCYFLSFNDRLEPRDLRNHKTDLHHICRVGRHVCVDVQSRVGYSICQGTLLWQPILARNRPKSATRLPSWDSHSTRDGRTGKRMGALTVQKSCLSCKNLANFALLTVEITVLVWRPFMRQMREIVEKCLILGTRIRRLMQQGTTAPNSHNTEDLFGPSLG